MSNIEFHIGEIYKILSSYKEPQDDIKNFDDLKSIKADVFKLDTQIKKIKDLQDRLTSQKIKLYSLVDKKVQEYKSKLETVEKYFNISSLDTSINNTATPKNITIDFDHMSIEFKFYNKKEDIPIGEYGGILVFGKQNLPKPLICYRASIDIFVSCSPIHVIDPSNMSENYRTITCLNGPHCQFGNNCKYYHDQINWPDSTHVQKFNKTNIIKNCPYFGNIGELEDQFRSLSPEHIITFIRYLSIMNLIVREFLKFKN